MNKLNIAVIGAGSISGSHVKAYERNPNAEIAAVCDLNLEQAKTYVLFTKLHFTDSYLFWILNGIGGSPFYTFLFRQFMQTVPKELEEAGIIDGCTILGIMFRIFLPLTVPAIAVVFMFEFLNSWGDAVQPFIPKILLVPLQLAASLLFIIPSVIVYFAGQKYIKEGMITSGLKGQAGVKCRCQGARSSQLKKTNGIQNSLNCDNRTFSPTIKP